MRKNHKSAIAVTVAIFLLIAVTIIVTVLLNIKSFDMTKPQTIKIPTINCSVTSVTGDEDNPVTVDFALQLDPKLKNKFGIFELRNQIEEIMNGLDYDRITEAGNIDYIKQNVTEGLEKYMGTQGNIKVLITDIKFGRALEEAGGPQQPKSSRDKAFENMFKKPK